MYKKASQRSTETEIRAMNIERNCEDCYKAEYMQQHIGEIFKGLISSVTEYGFYVELENTVEGLVHVNSLPEGNYIYDGFFSLTEEFSNTVYSVGTKVSVLCAGADVNSGKLTLISPTTRSKHMKKSLIVYYQLLSPLMFPDVKKTLIKMRENTEFFKNI